MTDKCGGTTMAVGEEKEAKALHDDVFASSSSSSSSSSSGELASAIIIC